MEFLDVVPFAVKAVGFWKDVRAILPQDQLHLSGRITAFYGFGPDLPFPQLDIPITNYSADLIHIKGMGLVVDGVDYPFPLVAYGTGTSVPECLAGRDSFDFSRLLKAPSLEDLDTAARNQLSMKVYVKDGIRRLAWGDVSVDNPLIRPMS